MLGSNRPTRTSSSQSICDSAVSSPKNSSLSRQACSSCKKSVLSNQKALMCDFCDVWCHLDCDDRMPVKMYTEMQRNPSDALLYICKTCKQRDFRANLDIKELTQFNEDALNHIETKVDKIHELVTNSIEMQLGTLQKSYADAVAKIETSSTKQTSQIRAEISSIRTEMTSESRSKNLIIFGMSEDKDTTLEESVTKVTELLKSCNLKHETSKANTTRLGQKKEDKYRPIRLALSSEAQKWEFLRRINDQRVGGVFARLDLNKKEQEADFLLRKELKETKQSNPGIKFKIIKGKVTKVGEL